MFLGPYGPSKSLPSPTLFLNYISFPYFIKFPVSARPWVLQSSLSLYFPALVFPSPYVSLFPSLCILHHLCFPYFQPMYFPVPRVSRTFQPMYSPSTMFPIFPSLCIPHPLCFLCFPAHVFSIPHVSQISQPMYFPSPHVSHIFQSMYVFPSPHISRIFQPMYYPSPMLPVFSRPCIVHLPCFPCFLAMYFPVPIFPIFSSLCIPHPLCFLYFQP